ISSDLACATLFFTVSFSFHTSSNIKLATLSEILSQRLFGRRGSSFASKLLWYERVSIDIREQTALNSQSLHPDIRINCRHWQRNRRLQLPCSLRHKKSPFYLLRNTFDSTPVL